MRGDVFAGAAFGFLLGMMAMGALLHWRDFRKGGLWDRTFERGRARGIQDCQRRGAPRCV